MWRIKRFINRVSRRLSRWYWHQPYWLQWCVMVLLYLLGIYMILNCFVGYLGGNVAIWLMGFTSGHTAPWWLSAWVIILSIASFVIGIIIIGVARGLQKRI